MGGGTCRALSLAAGAERVAGWMPCLRGAGHHSHLHVCLAPAAGHTVYHLNEQGLIALQDQTWSITGTTALVESFTPTGGVSTDIKQSMSA